ncbi:MAG: cytochrome C [Desulfuromonas sp.]|nr:MAG: cytochrome C [Desulfuromonas sp.]
MRKNILIGIGMTLLLLTLAACAALDSGSGIPLRHLSAEDLGQEPKTCTECHEGAEPVSFSRFNHTATWGQSHRQQAYQQEAVCAMCHQTSFCNDCHATRVELKPSLKNQSETYRQTPHRGDYLSRHRIDGKVDPTSCFRCHGNPKTAKTCAPCHG